MKDTATGISMRMNLRRRRSDEMLAAVLEKIRPFIDHDQMKDVHYALLDLFMEKGVEVLTDYHRQELGLPTRDSEGWTREEIAALEWKRMEALLAPMAPMQLPLQTKPPKQQ
jgi:hypothetical protein